MLLRRRPPNPGTTDGDIRRLDARWNVLNEPFTMNDQMGPSRGAVVLVTQGKRPLVFGAPHAVHHCRNGALKTNDANTGGLAVALAQHLGASVVALRRGGHDHGDPNADLAHPLKDEAAALVGPGVVYADLHGMADRAQHVIIGLGNSPTAQAVELATRFVEVAATHGVVAAIADEETGFNARGPATMTSWAAGRGASSMQFEIARALRSVKSPAERRAALLRTFVTTFG